MPPTTPVGAVYSPQGSRVATGSRDNEVRLWDAGAGAAIERPITGPRASVVNSVFSNDGKQIAVGAVDNEVWVWPAVSSPEDLCAKLTQNMSHKQWDEWVSPDIDYITGCPGLPITADQSGER